MAMEWKPRGNDEDPYKARLIAHEAATDIEYGEKTWTTAQTVRDIFQNHLDAETERFYGEIFNILFDRKPSLTTESEKEELNRFLYSAYMFVSHVEDMTPETRAISEKFIQSRAQNLPIRSSLLEAGSLRIDRLLEQTRQLTEHRPHVFYEVTDTQTNQPIGLIPYETISNEPLYQERMGDSFRFKINAVKIVDHGTGYDSQLTSLYVSSKKGKQHVRGKFGEGTKMSELHLLRHGARVKMQSHLNINGGETETRNRVWQIQPRVKQGRLVARGVEVEKPGAAETGSSTYISIQDADAKFQKELLENIDPRVSGLSKNISVFRAQNFSYPMPLTMEPLVGVDMTHSGEVQFVKGLRVELATESFGYARPWFSYDILDSGIIAGRDRNEINDGITKKINQFWNANDNPELLAKLVNVVVHDRERSKDSKKEFTAIELTRLNEILGRSTDQDGLIEELERNKRVQSVIDQALIKELQLVKGVDTLILPEEDLHRRNNEDVLNYAFQHGYSIASTASNIYSYAIESFAERCKPDFQIFSLEQIKRLMRDEETEEGPVFDKSLEQEREQKIRSAFDASIQSHAVFIASAGLQVQPFELRFENTGEMRQEEAQSERWIGQNNDEYWSAISVEFGNTFVIDSSKLNRVDYEGGAGLKEVLELCMLSVYEGMLPVDRPQSEKHAPDETGEVWDATKITEEMWNQANPQSQKWSGWDGDEDDDERNAQSAGNPKWGFDGGEPKEEVPDVLKRSQKVLDALIQKLIPAQSALLKSVPDSFKHARDPELIERLLSILSNKNERDLKEAEHAYEDCREAIASTLDLQSAKKLLAQGYRQYLIVQSRVFVEQGIVYFYNHNRKNLESDPAWQELKIGEAKPFTKWNDLSVYALDHNRYFIPAPMPKGSVLAEGEGKERKYTLNDGENFVRISNHNVGFETYNSISDPAISVHPGGIMITVDKMRSSRDLSMAERIAKELQRYSYYPTGTKETKPETVTEGIVPTALPIEYGADEWDNPVRVFQDVIQNHMDAAVSSDGVQLLYEVTRDDKKAWITGDSIKASDSITGISVTDNGEGYVPTDIATMGASSKKSPLFAGKYGEGQKMIAAAALRSGLDLEYKSTVQTNAGATSWSARAMIQEKPIILDGTETKKSFTAFNVSTIDEPVGATGSQTVLRISQNASEKEKRQWSEWVSTIDPREKDDRGNAGMARFIRQLRVPGSQKEYKLGAMTILLDEPGAVYENGLRINATAEKSRSLAFGYDVPEIVTTRERNSFNPERLNQYAKHIFSHLRDTAIIRDVYDKMVNEGRTESDLSIITDDSSAYHLWAQTAQEMWPGFLVHSHEEFNERETPEYSWPEAKFEREQRLARIKRARHLNANLVHFDRRSVLSVSKDIYHVLSKFLPTVEAAVDNLSSQKLPVSAETKKILSGIIAESTKIFEAMRDNAEKTMTATEFEENPLFGARDLTKRIKKWSDPDAITQKEGSVGVARIDSGFHGRADRNGIVFNEGLLLGGRKNVLAETSLHEMAHCLSEQKDYTQEFVRVLYDLAKHFAQGA